MNVLFLLSLAVLVIIPAVFIYHEVYEDGVMGRAFLGGILLFSSVPLMETFLDDMTYTLPAEIVCLIASFAGFISWHMMRFHRRVVRAKRAARGEIDRRAADKTNHTVEVSQ